MKASVAVSASQLAAIRTLRAATGGSLIGNNYRPTQPLYDREIKLFSEATAKGKGCEADWGFHAFAVISLLFCVVITVMCVFFKEKIALMEEKFTVLRNLEMEHLDEAL